MTGLNLETFLYLIRADLGLWASFAAIVAILALMAWTSWGSRRVLRKCLAASVVIHLGMIATGSQSTLGLRVLGLVPLATIDDPREQDRIRTIQVRPESEADPVATVGVDPPDPANPDSDSGRPSRNPLAAFDRPGTTPVGDLASALPLPPRPSANGIQPERTNLGTAPVAPPAPAVPEIIPDLPTEVVDRAVEEPPVEVAVADPPQPIPADAIDLPEVERAGRATPASDPLAALRSPGTIRPPERPVTTPGQRPRPSPETGFPPALDSPSLPSTVRIAQPVRPEPDPPARPEIAAADPTVPGTSNAGEGRLSLDIPSSEPGDDLPIADARPTARPAPTLAMPGRTEGSGTRPGLPMPAAPTLTPIRPAGRAPLAIARGLPTGALPRPEVARAPLEPRRLPDVPEVYRPRLDPERSLRAQQTGASRASEEAVERALIWLAAHQDTDGRWDAATETDASGVPLPGHDDFTVHCPPGEVCSGACYYWEADTATTGLALLAYLGAGYTHIEGRHAATVARGLEFLRSIQAPDGDLRHRSRAVGMYCHAMATLAICEAYAMTGDLSLRGPAERAVDFLLNSRAADRMSWRYAPGAPTGDTSILGWVILVLKSAEECGFDVPQTVKDGSDRWLRLVASGDSGGLAGYQPGREATPTMTAEAWVCRQFLGVDRHDASSDEAARYLLANAPGQSDFNLYYWYYGTLAMYQHGGATWDRWNAAVRDQLVSRQETSGHRGGSWDPALCQGKYDSLGGRIYSTALATLTLEVYYRYLRLDGPIDPPLIAPKPSTPGDPTLRRAGSGPTAPAAMPFPRRR